MTFDERQSHLCKILNELNDAMHSEGRKDFRLWTLQASTNTELDEIVRALKGYLQSVQARLESF